LSMLEICPGLNAMLHFKYVLLFQFVLPIYISNSQNLPVEIRVIYVIATIEESRISMTDLSIGSNAVSILVTGESLHFISIKL
jgi:hypothetical protein